MATRDSDANLRDRPAGEEPPRRDADLATAERKLEEVLATLRDSDVDLRDYMPDMATILREAHPGRAAEKLREASLTPLPFAPAAESPDGSASPAKRAPVRVRAPSPWAKGAPDLATIDKTALPSAMRPSAAGPERAASAEDSTPLVKAPTPESARPARRATIAKGIGAVIAVFTPLLMMYVLVVRPNENGHGGASSVATAASTATPPLPVTAAPSAAPTLSAKPMPQPSAEPTTTATVMPTPTVAPTIAPSLHGPGTAPKRPMRGGAGEEPRGAAPPPSPSATAAPTAAPTPTVSPELLH